MITAGQIGSPPLVVVAAFRFTCPRSPATAESET